MRRLVLLALLVACTEPAKPAGEPIVSRVTRRDIPMYSNRSIDLLFVIDSSPAMAAHREHLRASYAQFMTALETSPGGVPDVHIGVVSSDLGARGADGIVHAPVGACAGEGDRGRLRTGGAPVTGTFLSDVLDVDGTRSRNYTGSLAEAFTAMADVGATGCPFTQPLEAARRALDHNVANAGFVRDDAYLMIVMITAGDDCSFAHGAFLDGAPDAFTCVTNANELVAPADYAAFFRGLKPDPSKVMIATATGPAEPYVVNDPQRRLEPSCMLGNATATPARRLDALRAQFPNRSSTTPVCAEDLSEVMVLATQLLKILLGDPCFEESLHDREPSIPGTQAECSVWLEYRAAGTERILRECGTSDDLPPCWSLHDDPQNCPLGSGITLRLEPRAYSYPRDTHAIIECLVD